MKGKKKKDWNPKSGTIAIIISEGDSGQRFLPKILPKISKKSDVEVDKALSSIKNTLDSLVDLDDFSDVLSKNELEEIINFIDSIGKRCGKSLKHSKKDKGRKK